MHTAIKRSKSAGLMNGHANGRQHDDPERQRLRPGGDVRASSQTSSIVTSRNNSFSISAVSLNLQSCFLHKSSSWPRNWCSNETNVHFLTPCMSPPANTKPVPSLYRVVWALFIGLSSCHSNKVESDKEHSCRSVRLDTNSSCSLIFLQAKVEVSLQECSFTCKVERDECRQRAVADAHAWLTSTS